MNLSRIDTYKPAHSSGFADSIAGFSGIDTATAIDLPNIYSILVACEAEAHSKQ